MQLRKMVEWFDFSPQKNCHHDMSAQFSPLAELSGAATTVWTLILEVLGSNLSRDTYPDARLSGYPQSFQARSPPPKLISN
jgi:Ni2+-binding GTPase involved in maturation of urease and hydrogenase